jgi:dethiobiotin synthetase
MFHVKLFVTGTDTGVGKTFVTTALASELRSMGQRVFAWKPIETGVTNESSATDADLLNAAAGSWQTSELKCMYRFLAPLSPIVAARMEARNIDVSKIAAAAKSVSADSILVEGAGGLRVPISEGVDMSGLAKLLNYPLLVVGRAGLGTINHSVLTIEAARSDGHHVVGVVLSRLPEVKESDADENARQIVRMTGIRALVFNGIDPAQLVAFCAKSESP